MVRALILALWTLASLDASTATREADALGPQLAEIRDFSATKGEMIWPGYGGAPFGLLLIDADRETLLCRDDIPAGFAPDGRDAATGCLRFKRPKSGLPGTLLAAMPLFGPPSTIVIGTPAATGRTPAAWLRTVLHEHFHQWQNSLSDYYARTDALDLKGGDETGMWMLNFPFPYDDERANKRYAAASLALADALDARGGPAFLPAFDRFLRARGLFEAQIGARNWRYLEFQLWQEGIARWTEITLGRLYPDEAVRAEAAALETRTLERLRNPDLKQQGRELAYPFGAGEALLMEECRAEWRKDYERVLALGPLLAAARAGCAPRPR